MYFYLSLTQSLVSKKIRKKIKVENKNNLRAKTYSSPKKKKKEEKKTRKEHLCLTCMVNITSYIHNILSQVRIRGYVWKQPQGKQIIVLRTRKPYAKSSLLYATEKIWLTSHQNEPIHRWKKSSSGEQPETSTLKSSFFLFLNNEVFFIPMAA